MFLKTNIVVCTCLKQSTIFTISLKDGGETAKKACQRLKQSQWRAAMGSSWPIHKESTSPKQNWPGSEEPFPVESFGCERRDRLAVRQAGPPSAAKSSGNSTGTVTRGCQEQCPDPWGRIFYVRVPLFIKPYVRQIYAKTIDICTFPLKYLTVFCFLDRKNKP